MDVKKSNWLLRIAWNFNWSLRFEDNFSWLLIMDVKNLTDYWESVNKLTDY